MDNPVILAVCPDGSAHDALRRDLERRFGDDYRVKAAASATAGIATLEAMQAAGDEVAIVIAALQLPEMSGIDFLDRADDLHPDVRRGLLVTPGPTGMTEAVRRAMFLDRFDFQIDVPWISPEEWLYPTITDALSTWTRLHRPHFESVTLIGQQWSPRGHEIRDLLERSGVPYGFYAVDSPRGQELLTRHGVSGDRLPIAIHFSGKVLIDPPNEALAEALGVATEPPCDAVDVTVVGSGPAGLAAAVYGASEGLCTVVVECEALGGQAAASNLILNYLGFPRGLSGRELTTRAYYQSILFGALFVFTRRVVGLRSRDGAHVLTFENGAELESRAVVVASGMAPRRLGAPSLEALIGRGVYYGATGAEATTLRGEEVSVVGGGNSAGQAALHLAKYAARVTLLIRGAAIESGMSDYLVQRIRDTENIVVRLDTSVIDAIGKRRLRGLVLEERSTGARSEAPAAALFVEIGGEPHTGWLPDMIARDEQGDLLTGRDLLTGPGAAVWPLNRAPLALETSLPGVFAAGDVRHGTVHRVASAVGDGAVAIRSIHEYLDESAVPARGVTAGASSAGG